MNLRNNDFPYLDGITIVIAMRKALVASIFLILASQAVAKDRSASPLKPIDPGSWVSPDDYPSAALRIGAEGAVGVRVEVGTDGVPTKCIVAVSSGNADLDKAACDAIMLRAKFSPATDKTGKPIEGTYTTRIVWNIPAGARAAPPEGSVTVTAIVEKDGTVTHCEEKSTSDLPEPPANLCADKPNYQPILGKDGKPVRKRIVISISVHYEDVPDAAE